MKLLTDIDHYTFSDAWSRPLCGPCWRIFLTKTIHAERTTQKEFRKRRCCFCFKVKREIAHYLVFLSISGYEKVRLIHEMYFAMALEREKTKPRRRTG